MLQFYKSTYKNTITNAIIKMYLYRYEYKYQNSFYFIQKIEALCKYMNFFLTLFILFKVLNNYVNVYIL